MKQKSEQSATQRRIAIYDLLLAKRTVTVAELAAQFQVTPMTVRRDLAVFAQQGLVTATYGGAYLKEQTASQPDYTLKASLQKKEKTAIGSAAMKLIEDGDTIILDCGTTPYELAKQLSDRKLTVITNSWPLIQCLGSAPKIQLILAPGEYSKVSNGAISSATISFFQRIRADKVFMSTQGLDKKQGATVPELLDADVKRSMLLAAERKILLCDHSKWNSVFLSSYAELTEFDAIVTDDCWEETDKAELFDSGPEIHMI